MIREQDPPRPPFPLPQGLPLVLMQPQEEAGSCQQEKGKGLGHAWSCGTERSSCSLWECLPVQVVGAVPCNDSHWHIKDFIVFELEENKVCEWGVGEATQTKMML